MIVNTYNDYLRNLLGKSECVLACDTAADYLGLSNGSIRDIAQIYVTNPQQVAGKTEQIKINSFFEKKHMMYRGLLCTTEEQTIVDLLEQDGDEQIITESLANYYYDHNESFDELLPFVSQSLMQKFEKYSLWAKDYYRE